MSEVHWIRDAIEVEIDKDTVFVRTHSVWTFEVTVEYFQLLDQVRARNEHLFIIVDANGSHGIPDQRVRRLIATWSAKNTFSGMAIYGITPFLRNLALLIFNAANVFRRGSAPYHFVKNEEEARRLIAERRVALQAKSARSPAP